MYNINTHILHVTIISSTLHFGHRLRNQDTTRAADPGCAAHSFFLGHKFGHTNESLE